MSVIASIDDKNMNEHRVLCKGAPEVIKQYLHSVPKGYDEGFLKYVKNGARVLAMGYKVLPKMSGE
jgi:cation-transporting ATPase 13A1